VCAVDLDELLDVAVAAARAAGEFLVSSRPESLRVATKSTPTDVVTQMDTAAQRMIGERLRAERPDDAMLGEEGPHGDDLAPSRRARTGAVASSGRSRVRWIVDPIDGTVNYLYALPQWAVSIAAEVDGVVEVGAVLDPSKGELFTAVRGDGAFLNGEPIKVSGCDDLSLALIGTGFGYDARRRARQSQVLTGVLPTVRDIRRLGAASLDLCALACGRLDGYYERGLNVWDYAAAGLVAAEAGARVGGLNGRPASGVLFVAATPAVFDPLRDLLSELAADRD
jgi:myo-inositol-1(or 4)-monophosphatase